MQAEHLLPCEADELIDTAAQRAAWAATQGSGGSRNRYVAQPKRVVEPAGVGQLQDECDPAVDMTMRGMVSG